MIKFKDYYCDTRKMDSYNKAINLLISAREMGKSTKFWLKKVYKPFKEKGHTSLILFYNVVEITEAFLISVQDNILNKFTDDNVELQFNKGDFKSGVVDVKINGRLFVRLLALSIPLRRIKQALLKDIDLIWLDEYIVNPRKGEKYLKGLDFIISEVYSTYKRERIDKSRPLRLYFTGNPYSLYNPIHLWLKIDTNRLKLGSIIVGPNYVIEWQKMSDQLIEDLKKDNPMIEICEDYRSFAFDGEAINDTNIKVSKLPPNYSLRFVFRFERRYIGVYQNQYWIDSQDRYFCKFLTSKELSNSRVSYCFDFADLVKRCALLCNDDRNKFNRFKIAMRNRAVAFESIECYYLIEEIYFNL